jgi:hydroxyacylglutathione hydrolase
MPGKLKKWTTTNNLEIFQILNGRSNVYFVWNGSSGLMVDTGKKSSGKKLNKNLQQLKNEGKTIDFLALTHTHYDHCQNAAKIQAQENWKILVSQKEAEFWLTTKLPWWATRFLAFSKNQFFRLLPMMFLS